MATLAAHADRPYARPRVGRPALWLLTALVGTSCAEGPTAPEPEPDPGPVTPTVTAVEVTSPIGAIIAVGATARLTASATDAEGRAVTAAVTWSTDDEDVATVSASGVLTGVGVGRVSVRATADGVEGTLAMLVADADLEAIRLLLDDPFVEGLLDGMGGDGDDVRSAFEDCTTGRADGNLALVGDCIARARADLANGVSPERGPVAGLLALFVDWIDRFLNLPDEVDA